MRSIRFRAALAVALVLLSSAAATAAAPQRQGEGPPASDPQWAERVEAAR